MGAIERKTQTALWTPRPKRREEMVTGICVGWKLVLATTAPMKIMVALILMVVVMADEVVMVLGDGGDVHDDNNSEN